MKDKIIDVFSNDDDPIIFHDSTGEYVMSESSEEIVGSPSPKLSEEINPFQVHLHDESHRNSFIVRDDDNKSNSESSRISDLELSVDKKAYVSEDLKILKEKLIRLFYLYDIIIFTDDYKINYNIHCSCLPFRTINKINPNEFPGVLFMSFDCINLIKLYINQHNKKVTYIDSDEDTDKLRYQVCFDEGEITKNTVYKKLEIQDKILFVPISNYQLRLTEYKLRGFCQIMEEIGATEIQVEFNDNNSSSRELNLQVSNYNYIAGSLGFSSLSSEENGEEITYKLVYPEFNTFNLNADVIKSKIRRGKFIISKKNYDSNLELQYIISSRCKHYVENYSTVFTLDNSSILDYKMAAKLEGSNFSLGFQADTKWMKNLKLSINTSVKFSKQKEVYRNLIGDNLTWDSSGFNYLMGAIEDEPFDKVGIYKIISFTNAYIDNVIKRKNFDKYKKIRKIMKIINREFEFDEYIRLLLEYFGVNSHWLHFNNFLDVLTFTTVSYNKLGFLVLMSQTDLVPYQKNLKIINFIRHMSIINGTEDSFWKMLQPNNYYYCTNKLNKKYNVLARFNWFNLNNLLHDLSKFKVNEEINENCYSDVYNNFVLGYSTNQFNSVVIPFLDRYIEANFSKEISTLSDDFKMLINKFIKPKHIISYNVNSIERLNTLIKRKIFQLKEGELFYNNLQKKIEEYNEDNIDKLCEILSGILVTDNFKRSYPYIEKKINYVIKNQESNDNIKDICLELKLCTDVSSFCYNIIKKILLIDVSFSVENLELNKEGFETLTSHISNLPKFRNLKIGYFLMFVNFILSENMINFNNKINIQLEEEDIIEHIKDIDNYTEFINYSINYLYAKYNIEVDHEFYNLLKE